MAQLEWLQRHTDMFVTRSLKVSFKHLNLCVFLLQLNVSLFIEVGQQSQKKTPIDTP